MAEHESDHYSEHCNRLTRREACVQPAANVAMLPIGMAMRDALSPARDHAAAAELPTDADPGLAQLEAGYARWQEMRAEWHTLSDLEDEARGRAWDRVPDHITEPEPVPTDPDVLKLWKGPSGLIDDARDPESFVTIPQDLLAASMRSTRSGAAGLSANHGSLMVTRP
jgi:hypothetical protein